MIPVQAKADPWIMHVWCPGDASKVLCGADNFLASASPTLIQTFDEEHARFVCSTCAAILKEMDL